MAIDEMLTTDDGNSFQTHGSVAATAQSPVVFQIFHGTLRAKDVEDRRPL